MQIEKFLILVLLMFSKTIGQNTATYAQDKSIMFSNRYILNFDAMTFEHIYMTDDGQIWMGKGTYIIKSNMIILKFENPSLQTSALDLKYLNDKSIDTNIFCLRNLSIQRKGYLQSFVKTKLNGIITTPDSEGNIYIDATKNSDAKIEFLLEDKIVFSLFIEDLKKFNLLEIDGFSFEKPIHYESNFIRVLKFKGDYLISKDYYNTSKKKKVRFSKI
ncbi:hypothetical protein [Flavobacterium sp. H122]|uniref:hypothetical protein n=1 Tax=Flavobacterium sp. H122 TaxID=2529860 RepID=UPI0010AB2FCD|nr:hypothetical protein [Flavobacterium sp. H122]